MTPRLASLLAGLVLALTTSILPLPAGDAAVPESPAVCQAAGSATAPAGAPAGQTPALALDPTTPRAAAPSCKPDECAAFCAPLQSRCRSGFCVCLRDPL